MNARVRRFACTACVASLITAAALQALAGGPRNVNGDPANGEGDPMAWPLGVPIVYNPESGGLGQLSNAEARSLVSQAFAVWAEVLDRVFLDDMESGTAGWTSQDPYFVNTWLPTTVRSHSPSTSWRCADVATVSDARLTGPSLDLPPTATELSFWHYRNLEPNFDGGVLEYTTDGGANWQDAGPLITTGAYNAVISTSYQSPIGGRAAWSGAFGWTKVVVNLAALSGQVVRLRWRCATDNSVGAEAWYVDDVEVLPAAPLLSFVEGTPIPGDVAAVPGPNHWSAFWTVPDDGRSPVLFDADGSIIDDYFGLGARYDIVGMAALDTPISPTSPGDPDGLPDIEGASIALNGTFYDGVGLPASADDLSEQALLSVIVHEVGHFLNLDHSTVNGDLAGDGDPFDDIYLPTMLPFVADDEAALADLNPDDRAALRAIYRIGASRALSGVVSAPDGSPLQGAGVVVRKVGDPLGRAYAAISGARWFPFNPGGVCDGVPSCDAGSPAAKGAWETRYLDPGSYQVCVRQLDTRLSTGNGSLIGPLVPPLPLPGPEDCWDLGEPDPSPASDDPDDATEIVADDVPGVDIQLNFLPTVDPFEPNNSFAAPTTLANLPSLGTDTVGATIGGASPLVDFFAVPMVAGRRLRVDVEADELGSPLDAVVGVFDPSGVLIAVVDDAMDADSGVQSLDPDLELWAAVSGTYRVAISSYPDLDLDGFGGSSTGGYWLRVEADADPDVDGHLDGADNCPSVANPLQQDMDVDGHGDACDEDDDGDGLRDQEEQDLYLTDPLDADSDDDGIDDAAEVKLGTNPNDATSPGAQLALLFRSTISEDSGNFIRIAAGDVDGDGDDDLAATRSLPSGAAVWLRNTGGTYEPAITIGALGTIPGGVALGDLDRDGDLDVVVASCDDDTVAWFRNINGLGAFSAKQTITNTFDCADALALGDVDGDGDTDVAAAARNADTVRWFVNDGTPGGLGDWAIGGSLTGIDDPRGIALADLDRDGDLEMVVAAGVSAPATSSLRFYLNNGAGGFGAPLTVQAGTAPTSLAVGDLDRDGQLDLVAGLCSPSQVTAFLNRGLGLPWDVVTVAPSAGCSLTLAIADLDLDGDADIAEHPGVGALQLHENLGTGLSYRAYPYPGLLGSQVSATDADRDGDPDLVVGASGLVRLPNGRLHGAATFPQRADISTPAMNIDAAAIGDIDRDGDLDLVSGAQNGTYLAWYPNLGDGTYGAAVGITGPTSGVSQVALPDLDGDGDLDLLFVVGATTVRWSQNLDGAGSFAAPQTVASPAEHVSPADIDRDGDVDVVVAGFSIACACDSLYWVENAGGGGSSWITHGIDVNLGVTAAVTADIDSDGDVDVAVGRAADDIRWYANNGGGTFSAPILVGSGVADPSALAAADLDRDGDLDLAATEATGTHRVLWYRNTNGAGSFTLAQVLPGTGFGAGGDLVAADLDNDGDPDLAAASDAPGISRWENLDGAGTFSERMDVGGPAAGAVRAADLDRDGEIDLVGGYLQAPWLSKWPNAILSFDLTAVSIAPATIPDGAEAAILKLPFTHRGRAGDSPIALASVGLDVEGPAGPLSAGQANALVERLHIYRDANESGGFDSGDVLVATLEHLEDGTQGVPFDWQTDADVLASTGDPALFFVVVELTTDASRQAPNSLRIVYRPDRGTSVRSTLGAILEGGPAAIVPSGLATAVAVESVAPYVASVAPANKATNVSPAAEVDIVLNEPVSPETANPATVFLTGLGGSKADATVHVESGGTLISIHPSSPLLKDQVYTVRITTGLKDLAGNAAIPYTLPGLGLNSTFRTIPYANATVFNQLAAGKTVAGWTLVGTSFFEQSGAANAAVGDVDGDGIADLVVGAPTADDGGLADRGRVTLAFGSETAPAPSQVITFLGEAAGDRAGQQVARAGDLNGDGCQDILIGAPDALSSAGVVYVVYGGENLKALGGQSFVLADLLACQAPPHPCDGGAVQPPPVPCALRLLGEAPGDRAGSAISFAADPLEPDGLDDFLIGAPGATPSGRPGAGKVYLIRGLLGTGSLALVDVGSPTLPGVVFYGEAAGDAAGSAVSSWEDPLGSADDLLIGAPKADALDAVGDPIVDAGYVYAIWGGGSNLAADPPGSGVIELSRVAALPPSPVLGVVFVGTSAGQEIGRAVTGTFDIDQSGTPDIAFGANGEVWVVPGEGPKTLSGSTDVQKPSSGPGGVSSLRQAGFSDVVEDRGAWVYVPGSAGDVGGLQVAGAGDVDVDGRDDLVIGAPGADPGGLTDAGTAWIVLGTAARPGSEIPLSEIGLIRPGFVVNGAEPFDALGASVGGGFDLTGDAVDDVVLGAPFADSPGVPQDAGETYVLSPYHPDEIMDLQLAPEPSGTRIEWAKNPRAMSFNLYRLRISVMRAANAFQTMRADQLICDSVADADTDGRPDYLEPDVPPSRDGYAYLATGRNLQGEGPLGPPSTAATREQDLPCP